MKTLKQGWDKILGNKTSNRSQLEKQPYRCILCNDDMVRFAHTGSYVHHMTKPKEIRNQNSNATSTIQLQFAVI